MSYFNTWIASIAACLWSKRNRRDLFSRRHSPTFWHQREYIKIQYRVNNRVGISTEVGVAVNWGEYAARMQIIYSLNNDMIQLRSEKPSSFAHRQHRLEARATNVVLLSKRKHS